MKKFSFLIFFSFLLVCNFGHAQAPTDIMLTPIEESMLEAVHKARIDRYSPSSKKKNTKKKFRLVKTIENDVQPDKFDEIFHLNSVPEGAIATVHKKKTGEPLHSCITPCKLRVRKPSKKSIIVYKDGFMPREGIASGSWHESKIYLPKPYEPYLKEKARIANRCLEEFKGFSLSSQSVFYKRGCKKQGPLLNRVASKSTVKHLACKATFDIASGRWVENVRDVKCTDIDMCFPTYKAINKWVFYPHPNKTIKEQTKDKSVFFGYGSEEEKSYMSENRESLNYLTCFP